MANETGVKNTDVTRRGWLTTAASNAIAAAVSSQLACSAWAEQPIVRRAAIHGEIVLPRAGHDWMSQQVEEPCILPNPKVPGRLIMFYSAVSSSNRVVAAIGKAWADTRDPFRWHQDDANPVFRPCGRGGDSSTIRLDTVVYIPEEDAYYIYYSGCTGGDGTLPGIRLATSHDGKTWTRHFNTDDPR